MYLTVFSCKDAFPAKGEFATAGSQYTLPSDLKKKHPTDESYNNFTAFCL